MRKTAIEPRKEAESCESGLKSRSFLRLPVDGRHRRKFSEKGYGTQKD